MCVWCCVRERLGAMFSLCRQAAWRHRSFREDMWRSCQAAWQGLWLYSAVKLLGGRVYIVSWCCQDLSGQLLCAVIARDLGSSCGAGTTYRQFAWRRVVAFIVGRVAGCECCLLCRQSAWRHRVVSCCSALPESGRLARVADLGRSCQAAWQGRWLHLAVKLLGGRVHIVSWCRPAVWWH